MKLKTILIATLLYFVLVNTFYLWDSYLGFFGMFAFLFLIFYFLSLGIIFLLQVYVIIEENFGNVQRLIVVSLLLLVLSLSYFYPNGVIDFEKFEGETVLVAGCEGAANCTSTIKLRKDFSFSERIVCFGVSEISGKYRLVGDTVFFEDLVSKRGAKFEYKFAIIKPKSNGSNNYLGDLIMFHDNSDSIGYNMWIVENQLPFE
jgi:hypothetical protein